MTDLERTARRVEALLVRIANAVAPLTVTKGKGAAHVTAVFTRDGMVTESGDLGDTPSQLESRDVMAGPMKRHRRVVTIKGK